MIDTFYEFIDGFYDVGGILGSRDEGRGIWGDLGDLEKDRNADDADWS